MEGQNRLDREISSNKVSTVQFLSTVTSRLEKMIKCRGVWVGIEYSQTSIKRPLKGNFKSGLLKRWSLKKGLSV